MFIKSYDVFDNKIYVRTYSIIANCICVYAKNYLTAVKLLQDNAADEFTPISVEFFMSLDPVNVPNTDGNTSLSTLSSGPVLRVVGSNRVLVRMYM